MAQFHSISTGRLWDDHYVQSLVFYTYTSLLDIQPVNPLTPGAIPPPLMDNYLLPLMVNISVSMIGMEGEIQFVCFRVYNNKHINCFLLLIEGKDPEFDADTFIIKNKGRPTKKTKAPPPPWPKWFNFCHMILLPPTPS